jgi:hypothetical protein
MHETRQPEQRGTVVVGADGSAGAGEALRWAAAEARPRQTVVDVARAAIDGTLDDENEGRLGYDGVEQVASATRRRAAQG